MPGYITCHRNFTIFGCFFFGTNSCVQKFPSILDIVGKLRIVVIKRYTKNMGLPYRVQIFENTLAVKSSLNMRPVLGYASRGVCRGSSQPLELSGGYAHKLTTHWNCKKFYVWRASTISEFILCCGDTCIMQQKCHKRQRFSKCELILTKIWTH